MKPSFDKPTYEADTDTVASDTLIGRRGLRGAAAFFPAASDGDIHTHRRWEVGILLTGEGKISYASGPIFCAPGDVWLAGLNEPHGWWSAPNTRTVVLRFATEFLADELLDDLPWPAIFIPPPGLRPRIMSSETRSRALSIAGIVRQEILARRPAWESIARLELLHLLTALSRDWDDSGRAQPGHHTEPHILATIMPALSLVHSMPWRRVTVRDAAMTCGISVSSFHSLFRQAMQQSFASFCLKQRLALAAHLLSNTRRTVWAVGVEAGFADGSHLRRHFRKQYGCNPTEYRKRTQASSRCSR